MALLIDQNIDIVSKYKNLLMSVLTKGERIAPRGLATRTIRNVVVEIQDTGDVLLTGIGRGLSTGLLALEPLQLVGGFSDAELTVAVVPSYKQFMDAGMFYGAYGVRTENKVAALAEKLKKDPYTRQAYMTFWDDDLDHRPGYHDYPCTVGAHFQLGEDGRLHGTTTMRSNDAWLGFPYDIVQHTTLLKSLALFAGLEVGTYTHVVHNMHLYEKDAPSVRKLLAEETPFLDRPRLEGGIGTGHEQSWWEVQQRARTMLYAETPEMPPASEEEFWYMDTVQRMYTKLSAK